MKGIAFLARWSLLLAFSLLPAFGQIDPALREEGVLYFQGNLENPITAKLNSATTVYLRRDFQMAIAQLGEGQDVELIGMSPQGYLLQTTFRNNTLTGWIRSEDLPSGIDPSLFAQAQKVQEHRDAVAVAIANKSVIRGMTSDEVRRAVGRPEQTSSHTNGEGSLSIWSYTTYREVPQYSYAMGPFGRPVLQTYYEKIPVGSLIVTFDHDAVTSVEEHKTDPNSPGVVTN